ncbi:MAG: hypothetical protein ACTSU5_07320 [Promethearchaeota archaeon]
MTKTKFSVLLIAMMFVGVVAPAYAVTAKDAPGGSTQDGMPEEGVGEENVTRGVGAMLDSLRGQEGGDMIGNVFSILLGQMFTGIKEVEETIPGTYVFHAHENRTVLKDADLGQIDPRFQPGNSSEIVWLVDYMDEFQNNISDSNAVPYVVVNRTIYGQVNITYIMGVAVTVIIHDADGSFIRAISKVINAISKVNEDSGSEEAVKGLVSAFAYFFIHINDIITGDELLVVNPTHYEQVTIKGNYSESHHFYYANGSAFDNSMPQSAIQHLNETYVNHTDMDKNDHFLDWMINSKYMVPNIDENATREINWAGFSFDLMQLWMKKFHISIDFGELASAMQGDSKASGDAEAFNIFKDFEIEYYTISHHLVNPVLYDDVNDNHLIDVWYANATYPNGTLITVNDTTGTPKIVKKILSNEVKAVLGLKKLQTVNPWVVGEPTVIDNDGKPAVRWNITLNDPEVFWVPVHVSTEDWAWSLPTQSSTIGDISLGFTFTPGDDIPLMDVETGEETGITGKNMTVKLDQTWGKWSNPPSGELGNVDFAVVFFSTVTHFHMGFNSTTGDEVPEEKLIQGNQTYDQSKGEFTFGRDAYLKDDSGKKNPILGKVDIAGPEYQQYSDETTYITKPAQTQTIPWALFEGKAEGGATYSDTNNQEESYSVDAFVQIDVNMMVYSVNYYTFDGSGQKIVHDPTFSVYMTFPTQSFVAWIVVIAVVGLVGVAALLITRRKENR